MRLRGAHRALWLAPLTLVFERFHLMSIATPREAGERAASVAPRAVVEADLQHLAEANPRWTVEELRRRLEAGQSGFVREVGDRIVHCRWVSTGECFLPYLGRRFRPGPGRFVSIEAFTSPGDRRAGYYRESLAHALDWAADRGARELLIFVAGWHRPTLAVLRAIPAVRRIGAVTRLLGVRSASGGVVEVAPGVLGVD